MSWKEAIWAVIFPRQCPFCGKLIPYRQNGCTGCEPLLPRLSEKYRKLPGLDGFYAPFSYEGVAETAIRQLKFHGKTGRARTLAPFLVEALEDTEFDWIVPIPMSPKGLRERGYNQAQQLAHFLSEAVKIPLVPALEKCRETEKQHTLHARERRKNLKGAYRVRKNFDLCGKSILLCDDVVTTGSTILEAAETLRKAGAKKVGAVSVCKTVWQDDGKDDQ